MAANEKNIVNVVTVDQLAAVVKNKIEKILIIDSRSFLEFNTCHIINAVNVCCSKIVKRRLQQDKVPVKEFLMNTCHVMVHESLDVIVYDQNSYDFHTVSTDSFLYVLLTKLNQAFKAVNLLQGGFLEFQSKYQSLCEDKTRKCVPLTSMSQPCLPISNTGPTRILPFLYLGSQHDAMNKELLNDHNITYELNVSAACPKPDFISEGHFLRIPVNDNYSEKLLPHFPQAFQFVDKVREANGCVLIHCLAGISRSPTVAIAYIMQYLHMSSDDAYRYVKSKRATISPNFNFLGQLLEYEHQLRKENALKNKSHLSSSSGHGNKRHCRNAMRGMQKLDLKFPTQSKSSDEISSINAHEIKTGDQSPTTALAKLSFTSSEKDVNVENDNQKENLIESKGPIYHLNKTRTNNCVQKSNSTSNLRTSTNVYISGRRSSFDAGNKLPGIYCQEFSQNGYKSVSFEGLKGIPVSSLENINFTPCQTSGSSNFEFSKKSNICLENGLFHGQTSNNFSSETNCFKNNVSFNFSMQTQVWNSSRASEPYSGIFKHLHNPIDVSVPHKIFNKSENSMFEKSLSTIIQESSPRPMSNLNSPLTSVECYDDEGIDLIKEGDGKPKIDILSQGMQVLNGNFESGNLKIAEQGEFLESSYDSGVYPSPTQVVPFVSEFFNSPPKLRENDWLNTYEETSNKLTKNYFSDIEKNKTLINLSLHSDNLQNVCNTQINSDPTRSFTPIEKFSLTTTTVFRDKYFHINSSQKEVRLYRAQSCPGIVGFIHCTSSLDKSGANASLFNSEIKNSQMRRFKLSSVEREIRLRNRYSCDSLDLYNEGKSTSTFDSCPDFVHYGNNYQNDRNSNNNHEQPSLSPYQSFHQNTGIIQVS